MSMAQVVRVIDDKGKKKLVTRKLQKKKSYIDGMTKQAFRD